MALRSSHTQAIRAGINHRRRLLGALCLLAVLSGVLSHTASASDASASAEAAAGLPAITRMELLPTPPALAQAVSAPHWFVVEAATGQGLFGEGHHDARPVASAIKVLTALTVLRHAKVDEVVTVSTEAAQQIGASVGLRAGEQWTVGELLEAIIIRSGNDAATALALHVSGSVEGFVDLMRDELVRLGLADAVVTDPTGLDDDNRLTAFQLAHLGRAALHNDVLAAMVGTPALALDGQDPQPSRNLLLERYHGANGIKTGFTRAAGNVLIGSAQREGRQLVVVVLDADDDPARFDDAAHLLDHGFSSTHLTPAVSSLEATFGWGVRRWYFEAPVTIEHDESIDVIHPTIRFDANPSLDVEVVLGRRGHLGVTATRYEDIANEHGGPLATAIVDGAYGALRATAAIGELR